MSQGRRVIRRARESCGAGVGAGVHRTCTGDPCGHRGGGALTCAHVTGRSCAGGGPVATPSPRVARPDPANRIGGGGGGGQAREAEAGRGRRWRLCAETSQRQHVGRRSGPAAPEPRCVLPGAPDHPAHWPRHPADLLGSFRLPGDCKWGSVGNDRVPGIRTGSSIFAPSPVWPSVSSFSLLLLEVTFSCGRSRGSFPRYAAASCLAPVTRTPARRPGMEMSPIERADEGPKIRHLGRRGVFALGGGLGTRLWTGSMLG